MQLRYGTEKLALLLATWPAHLGADTGEEDRPTLQSAGLVDLTVPGCGAASA